MNDVQKKIASIREQLSDLEGGSDLSQLFRRVLDATDNTMTITDPTLPDNPLIYVNKEFESLTGYSFDEAVGRNCRFLQGDDRDQPAVAELREAVAEGRNVRVELRNYRKNGEMFWNELYITAIHGEAGAPKYFFGVQNDITELKELLETERDLRESLGERMAFVAVLDREGRTVRVDPTTLRQANLTFEEVEGERLEQTPWLAGVEGAAQEVRRCIGEALAGDTCRLDLTMRSGDQDLAVDFAFSPRRDHRGRVEQVIVSGVDVTARKRAAEALERSHDTLEERVERRTREVRSLASALTLAENRERHRLAQLLHDDLQQDLFATQYTLRSVQKRVQALPGGAALDEAFNELNDQLKGSVRKARGLTSDLSPPVLKEEGFNEALHWLAQRAQDQYGLSVTLDLPEPLPIPHEALRVLLLSLVRELFLNVVKHAETKEVEVRAERLEETVAICIRDAGKGFEAEVNFSPSGGATGFGLYSVAERLKLFGGVLKVASNPDEGTQVTIELPVASFKLGDSP